MSMMESPLADRAEAAILRLREVEGARVRAEGGELVEIHILSSSDKSPKQIVRDVEAILRTELDLAIDRRIVSVALAKRGAPEDPPPHRTAASRAAPAREPERTAPAFAPEPQPAARAESPLGGRAAEPVTPAREERIRYENANLIVHGPRTQAQVELRWKGLPRIGNASGWSARDDAHRLVATATTLAVQEFLADPVALGVREVSFVEAGGKRVAVVVLSLLAHRHQKVLTGCCTVEQDTPQAVVLATLAALNRLVAGLRVKEPTEYVLRAEGIATEV
jgi:hypothetical protein